MNTANPARLATRPNVSSTHSPKSHLFILPFLFVFAVATLSAQSRESHILVWSGAAVSGGAADWTAANAWTGTDGSQLAFQNGDAVVFGVGISEGEGFEGNVTVALPNDGVHVSAMMVNFSTAFTSTLAFVGGPLSADGSYAVAGSTEIDSLAPLTGLPSGYDRSPLGRLYINGGYNKTTVEFRSTDSATGLPVNPSFARDIIYRYTLSEAFLYFNTPGSTITSNLHIIPTGTNHYFKLALADGANFAGDIRLGTNFTVFQLYVGTAEPNAAQNDYCVEISGNIIGPSDAYGNVYGVFSNWHSGTTVLSGSANRYGGTLVRKGTLLVTSPGALGSGGVQIYETGHLVFQGLPHTILPMSFFQDTNVATPATTGTISIIDSDLVFRRVPNHAAQGNAHGAYNFVESKFSTLILSGTSRLLAIPTGNSTSVLGGPGSNIIVGDNSTLILDAHTNTRPDITIPIKTLALDGGTLVLRPGASLSASDSITLSGDAKITFEDSGIARLAYGDGSDPRLAAEKAEDADNTIYTVPSGMTVSTTLDPGVNTYVVVNQAAHPLKGIAMSVNAVGAIMDTVSSRLDDNFLQPVADRPAGNRRWANTAWLRAFNRQAERDTEGTTVPGHEGDLNGAVIGLDATLRDSLLLGFHAGLADSTLDTVNGTNLTTAQRFYGVHLAQRLGLFYLAANLSSSTADSSSRRYSDAGSTIARWDTTCYSGDIEAGAVLQGWKGFSIRASAGLRYMKFKTAKHVETGPGAMEIDDFSDELAQGIFSLRASQRFRVFKRDAAFGLLGSFKNSSTRPRTTMEAAFVSDPDRTPVMLECPDYYYGDIFTFGASLRMNVSKNTLIGINYERETTDKGHFGTIGAHVAYHW